ncbi:ATP-binding protein [Opitutus terrae]|uniref:ORC1/DEAH AAA+ ATPase domain-containing protein n=1 Tax=Opitutus terrae (strain DSM 11246 / JCM 15787 / PB90-1) TaxID=452637 RepID=B1ZSH6_OPITP|nr:ATP-binding protein [Opitutus terrae]ACB73833.1 hypothetical protein Oter_0543 [Opitutus terrae PB90-1]
MKRGERNLAGFPFFNEDYTFVHPNLVEAVNKLKLYLATPGDAGLITIIGPTGAGKTHVGRELVKAIIKENAKEMIADLQFLPAVLASIALLTAQGKFNWTLFYTQLLTALQHPNPSVRDLAEGRRKLQTVLQSRRVLYLLLDEADHFISDFAADDVEGIEKQANVLKSIVQGTGTRLVLIGSYDVAPLVRLNGQLARRNRRVHMARYRSTAEDRRVFRSVLRDMDVHFRGYFSFSLQEHHAVIYESCIGLMGVLRDWLALAAKASMRDGESTISLETLFAERIPIDVLKTILDCAENGEARFHVSEAEAKDFKRRVAAQ